MIGVVNRAVTGCSIKSLGRAALFAAHRFTISNARPFYAPIQVFRFHAVARWLCDTIAATANHNRHSIRPLRPNNLPIQGQRIHHRAAG